MSFTIVYNNIYLTIIIKSIETKKYNSDDE